MCIEYLDYEYEHLAFKIRATRKYLLKMVPR